ncbi:hypothetical protein [Streptomyces sp. rh34]|uniref:hypothetical protein n=1 Tax=Streptomyces sp. rh34 TaxID=2034272 RepID=UPI0015CF0DBB|nr:hypothetical protein [Streptomyces sp. rh34]
MDTETAPRAGVCERIGLAALALPAMLVIMGKAGEVKAGEGEADKSTSTAGAAMS